ncbi:hypothetical protein P8C59_009098 [Phyllachora maydis]|uniref:chitinase n=1 Tax=Phyllachora maydis TaxID=1825666 RepID=A0AAD9MJA6_9PEZI|nr:hypothetical protein P8C59_009098 [Phyllachora maydis]
MDYTFNFNTTPSVDAWEVTAGEPIFDVNNGATFTIKKQGDSPTIRTKFYYFFGRTEVWMKTAPGTGIISSVMTLSDDLDEVDWEFMGGNATHAETNYFGKGRQDFHNAIYYPVDGGHQAAYHNYTTVWTNSSLLYFIDDQLVRTLAPQDANGTQNYPQTPMRLSLGIWAGGDPTLPEGTRQWAGGDTDYSKGPFHMFVKSARVTDFSSGREYSYGDHSGTWQSIQVTPGNSTVQQRLLATPRPSLAQMFDSLPSGAKIGIVAGALGAAAVGLAWALLYCIRQRWRGARQAQLADAKAEEERMELARYKAAGVDPDRLVAQSEYDVQAMPRAEASRQNSYSVPGGADSEKFGAAGRETLTPMPVFRTGSSSPFVPSPLPYSDHPQQPLDFLAGSAASYSDRSPTVYGGVGGYR